MNYESRIKKIKNRLFPLIHYSLFIIHKSQKGFTLIELMVVLSITAVLGTLGIAGFTTYNQVQTLQSSANEVVTMLNLAKSRAQSQVKLGSACDLNSKILKGYSVDISIADSSYDLTSHCSVGGSELTSIIDTKTLPQNVTFGNTSSTSFFFPVLTGGVQTAGQVVVTGFGRDKIIVVNSLGGISVQAPTPTPTPTLTPIPTPTPTPLPYKRVFVTSQSYNGNLGGLLGGDSKCQTLASNAGLGGTWMAWLSDGTESPNTRFTKSMILPYALVNGTRIADNWGDLIDGNLTNPIQKTEANAFPPTNVVFTGTNANATGTSYNCGNWTNINLQSKYGLAQQTSSEWSNTGDSQCGLEWQIYCFEQ